MSAKRVDDAAPESDVRYPLVSPQASAEVVENANPLLSARNADAEVVENALPWFWARKKEADVVEKKLVVPCQKAALVVENDEDTKPESLVNCERFNDDRDETPVPPFVTGRMPKIEATEKVEVADTTPTALDWRKPRPSPNVRFVVEAVVA